MRTWLAVTRSSSLGVGGGTAVGWGWTRAGTTAAGGSYFFGSISASGGEVSDEQPPKKDAAARSSRGRNVRTWRMRRRSYVHRLGQASDLEETATARDNAMFLPPRQRGARKTTRRPHHGPHPSYRGRS